MRSPVPGVFHGPQQRRDPRALPRDHPLPAALRRWSDEEPTGASRDPLGRDPQTASLEAALFAADEPLPPRKLAQISGLPDSGAVRRILKRLADLYEAEGAAFGLEEVAGGFQLLTRPAFHFWLARLRRGGGELRLTPAAGETLAIVAYRQPIMRADIEGIRGVHCGETLRLLMEKGLVRITGRHDSLGRPVLYGTTRKFLQVYGLRSLKDLPRGGDL